MQDAHSLDRIVRTICSGEPGPSVSDVLAWCCQRLPSPLVVYWCGTNKPCTLQHIHQLRNALGAEQYSIVLYYKRNHMQYGDTEELKAVTEFNEVSAKLSRKMADHEAAGGPLSPEDAMELDSLRARGKQLSSTFNASYKSQLLRMKDLCENFCSPGQPEKADV